MHASQRTEPLAPNGPEMENEPAWPPQLLAALDALPGHVELESPEAAAITLGEEQFTRSQLDALLTAWNPPPRCANGHVLTGGPSARRACYCGAPVTS